MRRLLARFVTDRSGATAIEYAVMVALIGVILIGAVTTLGQTLANKYAQTANDIK